MLFAPDAIPRWLPPVALVASLAVVPAAAASPPLESSAERAHQRAVDAYRAGRLDVAIEE